MVGIEFGGFFYEVGFWSTPGYPLGSLFEVILAPESATIRAKWLQKAQKRGLKNDIKKKLKNSHARLSEMAGSG